jgi:hypothetical protein
MDGIAKPRASPVNFLLTEAPPCRYKTPNFTDIDQVGIKPDQVCRVGQDLPAGLPLDPETAFRYIILGFRVRTLDSGRCLLKTADFTYDRLGYSIPPYKEWGSVAELTCHSQVSTP